MPPLCHHILPLTYTSESGAGPKQIHTAAAALVWLDRPFAVTCVSVLERFAGLRREDPGGRISLGEMRIADLSTRTLCRSAETNLATLRIEPDELPRLGPHATFFNPDRWPARPVEAGEEVVVVGFPQDQWPTPLRYTFTVESVGERRFSAQLRDVPMPGRHQGLCGAPIFRLGRGLEMVGVVVESLFHNETIRGQHAVWLAGCGTVPLAQPSV